MGLDYHPDKPWDWHALSLNPHLTDKVIEKYPGKPWNFLRIARNHFLYDDDAYKCSLEEDVQVRVKEFTEVLLSSTKFTLT